MTEALKQLRHAFFILLISIIDFKQDKESMGSDIPNLSQ